MSTIFYTQELNGARCIWVMILTLAVWHALSNHLLAQLSPSAFIAHAQAFWCHISSQDPPRLCFRQSSPLGAALSCKLPFHSPSHQNASSLSPSIPGLLIPCQRAKSEQLDLRAFLLLNPWVEEALFQKHEEGILSSPFIPVNYCCSHPKFSGLQSRTSVMLLFCEAYI